MSDPRLIISLTPGLDTAVSIAKRRAIRYNKPIGVWEHVGLYGRVEGDIPARHSFRTIPLDQPDPLEDWALVACVDPNEEEK